MIDIYTYLNRITSQHKTKPKYMEFLAARLQPFIDIAECLETFDAAFDLDTAVGNQLDIIGKYVGVERLLSFQPQYAPALLPDDFYRLLLRARISLNNWDGTTAGIQEIWGGVFPNYTIEVVDNQDMTMNVRIYGLQTLFESEIIQHGYITPKPMGVLINFNAIFSITVDSVLYVGMFSRNRFLRKRLPAPSPPTDNSKPPGDLYIAGLNASNVIRTTAENKPPADDVEVDSTTLYAGSLKTADIIQSAVAERPPPTEINPPLIDDFTVGGLYTAKSAVSSIAGKPTMGEFAPLSTSLYSGGLRTTSVLRFTLESAQL